MCPRLCRSNRSYAFFVRGFDEATHFFPERVQLKKLREVLEMKKSRYHADVATSLYELGKATTGGVALTADEISLGGVSDAVMKIVTIYFNEASLTAEYGAKVAIFDCRSFLELEPTEIEEQKRIVDELWDMVEAQKICE